MYGLRTDRTDTTESFEFESVKSGRNPYIRNNKI